MDIFSLLFQVLANAGGQLIIQKFWENVQLQNHYGHNNSITIPFNFNNYYFPGQNFIIVSNENYNKQRKAMLEIIEEIEEKKLVSRYMYFHERDKVLWLCEKYGCLHLVETYIKEERETIPN